MIYDLLRQYPSELSVCWGDTKAPRSNSEATKVMKWFCIPRKSKRRNLGIHSSVSSIQAEVALGRCLLLSSESAVSALLVPCRVSIRHHSFLKPLFLLFLSKHTTGVAGRPLRSHRGQGSPKHSPRLRDFTVELCKTLKQIFVPFW